MIQVYLVAAYASVRAGLEALLAEAGDIRVIGRASRVADLESQPMAADVLLLDARPGDVQEAISWLQGTAVGLVILADAPEDGPILRRSGLRGWAWLPKEAEAEQIMVALQAAAAGLVTLDPARLAWLTETLDATDAGLLPADERLTPREREVLQLMAQGLPNKQIAARLTISTHTVKFHVASLLTKFRASSRTEAVTQGVRRGEVLL